MNYELLFYFILFIFFKEREKQVTISLGTMNFQISLLLRAKVIICDKLMIIYHFNKL